MTLRLYPLPSLFDDDVLLLKQATPVLVSAFYLQRPFSVPWSVNPTTFILETDDPAAIHTFKINNTDSISFIPGVASSSVQFQLVQGANRIDIEKPGETFYITVAATGVETWFRAVGREYYLSVSRRLKDVQDHFKTPWTTRVSAHFLPYTDLFLPARMPKIQQTRLAILTSTGGRLGHGDGVKNIAMAVSYSTPWVTRARDSEFAVPGRDFNYPGVTSHPTTGADKGRVFDLWYPNQCLAAKLALMKLALNLGADDVPEPKPLKLIDSNDLELLLQYGGGAVEAHYLNPLAPECSDIDFDTSCDAAVRVFAELETRLDIMMMTPQLPFDETVESPFNFGFFDMGFAFDGSTGSGEIGLGGDDEFDTVDPDDLFGTGFAGFSLSRRMDVACLDTRIQVGNRLAKFVEPLVNTSSPTPTFEAGLPLVVDGKPGAPATLLGATIFWATAPRNFLYQDDYVRFEEPDADIRVVTAWPVFDAANITKSDPTGADASVGTKVVVSAPVGFFEQQHKGMGLRVAGSALYSIADVAADGSSATLAGNGAALPGGSFIINVYEPVRDRNETAFGAGRRTFEITLASALLADIADGTSLDLRWAPRVSGSVLAAATTIDLVSDVYPRPGDRLYLDTSTFRYIDSANQIGTHHTTGFPIYLTVLATGVPSPIADNAPLYVLRADPCFQNGDPVTPLMLTRLRPVAYLTP